MKNYLYGLLAAVIVALPAVSFAGQGFADGDAAGGRMEGFFEAILGFINDVLIPVVLGVAFLVFIWGVFKFFILGGSDSEKQAEGKSLMIYAVAGFVIILSFYGLVNFLTQGLGFDNETIVIPNVPEERQ
jgi:Type IV secretion system pilin